ncbi:hypothetical protein [Flagellimonas sp. S3867]|uniref:hypothetical protein n=1 Tax=Flagellimonas sp. S3867 TaxID=2768063 RepID=UPI00168951DF|nr:hypothetical protein [Flagellimonas sp. S3867]
MKHCYILSMLLLVMFGSLQAQEKQTDLVEIGDKLVLGAPSTTNYSYINIPRKNFIIKRGGLPNTSSLINASIVVTAISYGEKTLITFKRTDGRKFFRVYKTLTADLAGGISTGELIFPEKVQEDTKESR